MRLQADGNPYPDGWSSGEWQRLQDFIENELVLPWYERRRLLAIVRALAPTTQEDRHRLEGSTG